LGQRSARDAAQGLLNGSDADYYLVTDPWTGATRWVGQTELVDGSWYKNKFGGDTSTFQALVTDKNNPL